jgi:hypothetical protein
VNPPESVSDEKSPFLQFFSAQLYTRYLFLRICDAYMVHLKAISAYASLTRWPLLKGAQKYTTLVELLTVGPPYTTVYC